MPMNPVVFTPFVLIVYLSIYGPLAGANPLSEVTDFNLHHAELVPEWRITVQHPKGATDAMVKELGQKLALRQGAYDNNVFLRHAGSQRFRALPGSHAGNEGTIQVLDAVEVVFTIPRELALLQKAFAIIFEFGANEDPTVHVQEIWGSRSHYLNDKDNPNRYWNRPDAELLHGVPDSDTDFTIVHPKREEEP